MSKNTITRAEYDNGDYITRYALDNEENGRPVCAGIIGYTLGGVEMTAEEIDAAGFRPLDDSDIQHALDAK